MSLDWNIEKCDASIKTDEEWPVTEALIWASMYCGFREITEANAEDVATRIHAWEKAFTPALSVVDEAGNLSRLPITLADVRKRIGLRTNASTMTPAGFRKHLAEAIMREASYAVNREARKLATDTESVG